MRHHPPLAVLTPILGALALVTTWAAGPAPVPERDPAPHLRVSRPTPIYALPFARARVLFVLKPGQEVRVLAGALQTGASMVSPAARPFESTYYDPDLSTDVVDHVSEGYTLVFHDLRGAAGEGPGAAAGASGAPAPSPAPRANPGSLARDCGAPPTDGCAAPALREPDNSGVWLQVSPDGRQRGWVLVPTRPAVRP
jgi:hypothetical protein